MLVHVLLFYLSKNTARAAPISSVGGASVDINTPLEVLPCTCPCPDLQRSVWDILWSCLATIFSCSWVSVHPNIPGPNDSRIRITLRRLELMFYAIVAPEMVICLAMRQWFGARELAQKWRGKGWTKTHGYFIQMGGFMLYESEERKGVLSPEQLEELFRTGKIKFPTITEKEIQDRSKADALSKALVIGQTAWFMLQCIARVVQGLQITHLELLTVALAVLNAFMYFFWWNKPLNVQIPVGVHLLDTDSRELARSTPASPDCIVLSPFSWRRHRSFQHFPPHLRSHFSAFRALARMQDFRTSLQDIARHAIDDFLSTLGRTLNFVKKKGYRGAIHTILIRGPISVVMATYKLLCDMNGNSATSRTIDKGQICVSAFYACPLKTKEYNIIRMYVSTIAEAFGVIHCAGWALASPSVSEVWIWRISSIAISVTPPLVFFSDFLSIWNAQIADGSLKKIFVQGLTTLFEYPSLAMLPLYVVARIFLLVEAFTSLRALVPGALAVVKWTTFMPHI